MVRVVDALGSGLAQRDDLPSLLSAVAAVMRSCLLADAPALLAVHIAEQPLVH